jgi:hypothetical protein
MHRKRDNRLILNMHRAREGIQRRLARIIRKARKCRKKMRVGDRTRRCADAAPFRLCRLLEEGFDRDEQHRRSDGVDGVDLCEARGVDGSHGALLACDARVGDDDVEVRDGVVCLERGDHGRGGVGVRVFEGG